MSTTPAQSAPRAEGTLPLEYLARVSDALAATKDLDAALATTLELIVPGRADFCLCYVADERGELRQVAEAHADARNVPELRAARGHTPPPDSLVAHAFRSARTVHFDRMPEPVLARLDENVRAFIQKVGLRGVLAVPLLANGEPVGGLSLAMTSDRDFSPADVAVLEELGRRAGLAIMNARLVAGARAAAERMSKLQRISEALADALSVQQVGDAVLSHALLALGASTGSVFALDEESGEVCLVANLGLTELQRRLLTRVSLDARLPVAEAVRTGREVWLSCRAEYEAQFLPFEPEYRRPVAELAVATLPLIAHGRILGAVSFTFDDAREFSPDDHAFLGTIARHGAQAMERARIYALEQQSRQSAEDAAALAARLLRLSGRLGEAATQREVARVVVDEGPAALGAFAGFLCAVDEGGSPNLLAASGVMLPESEALTLVAPVLRDRRERRVVAPGALTGESPSAWAAFARDALVLPLECGGRVQGALGLLFLSPRTVTTRERQFVETLLNHAAQALQRARFQEAERRAREEAEAARRTLEAAVNASPIAIVLLDQKETVRLWNPAAEALFGWRAAEVVGAPNPTIPQGTFAEENALMCRHASSGSLTPLERTRLRRDGSRFTAAVWSALAPDGGTLRLISDVSERQREEARLRFLAEAGGVLTSSLDLTQTLGQVLRLAVPVLGSVAVLDTSAVKGLTRTVAAVDDEHGRAWQALREAVPEDPRDPGRVAVMKGESIIYAPTAEDLLSRGWSSEVVERFRRTQIRSVMLVPIRARGRTVGVFTFCSSEREYTPADLRLAEELARRAALAMDNARLFEGEQQASKQLGVLARVSAELSQTLDYEETLEKVVRLALPLLGDFGFFDVREEDGEVRRIARAHEDPRRQAIIEGTRWVRSDRTDMNLCALSSGETALHPDIDEAWLKRAAVNEGHLAVMRDLHFGSMLTVPLRGNGELIGSLTLFHDKDGRRHTEADRALAEELASRAAAAVMNARLYAASQQAVKLRDNFMSIASHELRTPLSAVSLAIAATLRSGETGRELLPPSSVTRLQRANRQVRKLTELVGRLLDVSRLTSGRLELVHEEFDLAALLREVKDRFFEELGPRLTVEGIDGAVVGEWDRLRVEQVVTNLLSNAARYADEKPVALSLTARADSVRITVADKGPGIPLEQQKRLFGRFERGLAANRSGGLGLGLWITREFVLALGGSIDFSSVPGEGATFVVELPRSRKPA